MFAAEKDIPPRKRGSGKSTGREHGLQAHWVLLPHTTFHAPRLTLLVVLLSLYSLLGLLVVCVNSQQICQEQEFLSHSPPWQGCNHAGGFDDDRGPLN